MKKILLILVPLFLTTSCQDQSVEPTENSSWTFVANEGDFGASNGSVSMIDDNGNIFETESLGDIVQSLAVYENKLIVLINNSHKIKIYNITSEGLAMPGIEIDTENSSPREMVVNDGMVYFTNWNTSDVKRFNLTTYSIDASIPVGLSPEGIILDEGKLWVANSGESTVSEIDINTLVETKHEVGSGPQQLAHQNGNIYVSRTFYSSDWTETYHGASKIGSEILINNYGVGAACGGSILTYDDTIYRSFDGGLARMDNSNLNLDENIIGDFEQPQVYHVEEINGNIWFAITDYNELNQVHVVDFEGNLLNSYEVGQNPGDFVYWQK
tara:strand:- start:953 stop:1933 length:981 start_codon:yes stop_codon:yes gene_type:complete